MPSGAPETKRVTLRGGRTVLVALEVTLPESGIGEHMTGILRAVAEGDFELATPAEGEPDLTLD